MNLRDLVQNQAKCDELLQKLDEIATDFDHFEYGLPLFDEGAKARLREALYVWASTEPEKEPVKTTSTNGVPITNAKEARAAIGKTVAWDNGVGGIFWGTLEQAYGSVIVVDGMSHGNRRMLPNLRIIETPPPLPDWITKAPQ